MSEIVRWGMALTFLASLWGMAAFLIYKQVPGWGWFLLAVTIVAGSTSFRIEPGAPKTSAATAQSTALDAAQIGAPYKK